MNKKTYRVQRSEWDSLGWRVMKGDEVIAIFKRAYMADAYARYLNERENA